MGNLTSQTFHPNCIKEAFMITSLSRSGPTPYTLDLIPGGSLKDTDDAAVVRHKFKMAIRKQTQLAHILHGIDRKVTRCLSPCLMSDFTLEGPVEDQPNVYSYTWADELGRSRSEKRTRLVEPDRFETGKQRERSDLGSLDRLASPRYSHHSNAEDFRVSRPLKGILREKKARSRPERTSKSTSGNKRFALSVTEVRQESLPSIQEAASEVIVEKIELGGKRSRKLWPSRELIKSVLMDPKTRPTTLFLGRFRPFPEAEPVEVDYRFYKQTGNATFSFTGNVEPLLSEEERCKYQIDKFNNNLDEKAFFLKNVPYFLNNHYARIFWNGYTITLDGARSQRMNAKSIDMNPPTLTFDMSGLQHISASRNHSKFSLNGHSDEGDGASKSFVIRGKNETELKALTIAHEPGTVLVCIGFPIFPVDAPISDSQEKLSSATDKEPTAVPTN